MIDYDVAAHLKDFVLERILKPVLIVALGVNMRTYKSMSVLNILTVALVFVAQSSMASESCLRGPRGHSNISLLYPSQDELVKAHPDGANDSYLFEYKSAGELKFENQKVILNSVTDIDVICGRYSNGFSANVTEFKGYDLSFKGRSDLTTELVYLDFNSFVECKTVIFAPTHGYRVEIILEKDSGGSRFMRQFFKIQNICLHPGFAK